MKLLPRIAWYMLLLIGFVICLKSVREPDLWWMYRTGEWMLEKGQVTYSDPFSYTKEGVAWVNVKWLFEVLITTLKNIGGPEMVFVLQAIFTVLILWLIGKTTQLLAAKLDMDKQPQLWLAAALAAAIGLLAIDYRLIGRPEMSSHLLTAAFIYLFVLNHQKPESKWIYALIPLQVLWTNLHEAFGTGMVLIVAFLLASWLEYYWRSSEPNAKKPLTLTWASLAALAAIAINPRGPEMWLHPFNIFGQLADNKFTTELMDYKTAGYWAKEAYISIAFLLISGWMVLSTGVFAGNLAPASAAASPQKKEELPSSKAPMLLWVRYGVGYLLVGAMLFYLSLTAYRNIPFFIIAATPLVALGLSNGLAWLYRKVKALEMAMPIATIAFLLLFYVGIVSGTYHKWTGSRDQYGLQVLNGHNPVAASNFIRQNKIKGRCFGDYLVSSYLLWDLKPEFKTYIDLRDLDIFPKDFFEHYNLLLQDPKLFDEEDKKYNFDYVVLLRRNIEMLPMLYAHLQNSGRYELVFADAVAVLYLKQHSGNQALIDKYALDSTGTRDVFHPLEVCKSSALPAVLNKVFNPLFQNTNYKEVDEAAIAGHLYYSINELELGLKYAKQSSEKGSTKWRGYEIEGLIYARRFLDPATPADQKAGFGQQAIAAFDKALAEKPDALEAIFGKAVLLMENQKFAEAIPYLQTAMKLSPQNPQIQQHLSVCYQKLGK